MTLAMAGEPGRLAVRAGRQTAARGSRGRNWETLGGNLALSVLLRPGSLARDAGHWALLAAVALAEALEGLTGAGACLSLKWPNDVLLNRRKLGGILLDTHLSPDGRLEWVVIGCGVNLAEAPAGAAHLPETGPAELADAFLGRLDVWDHERLTSGFAAVRRAWLAWGPPLGEWLRVIRPGQETAGAFAGLSDEGALLLQTGGQVHAFNTGEILLAES